jgi:hypothetical protein
MRLPRRTRAAGSLFAAATMYQLGGCDFGQITTTVTLDGSDFIVTLVRGAILTPLDNYITNAVNNLFDEN